MTQVAKIFTNGRSQAVRLPAAYRLDTKEVFIRQDAETSDVILSRRPTNWDGFFGRFVEPSSSLKSRSSGAREKRGAP